MNPPPNAHAILAHYFTGPGYPPAQGALTVDEWEAGLDAYGTRLIPSREWIDRALAGKQKDEVCISFDDGLREAYVLALPSLEKRGLTACWNLYTGPYVGVPNRMEDWRWLRNHGWDSVEGFYREARERFRYGHAPFAFLASKGYLTQEDRDFRFWRNLRDREDYEAAMAILWDAAPHKSPPGGHWIPRKDFRKLATAGHVIGFHTHSHPTDMTLLSHEAQYLEYATSMLLVAGLTRVTVEEITTMAHPCDSVTAEGLAWLREHGIQIGWGGDVTSTDLLRAPRWSTGFWGL